MRFIHEPLTWAFFLVLVPLLIHLINLVRQQRVRWAAMEFLLKSYKKHRRWVWLKQWLLLLSRMAAVAAAVSTLAKLVTDAEWTSIFSQMATHHYILLDDSLSMSDRAGSGDAFHLARLAVDRICAQAKKQGSPQKLTLVRYSQANQSSSSDPNVPAVDIKGEMTDAWLRHGMGEVSQLAVGPGPALELAEQRTKEAKNERQVLHIVSDFRAETWNRPGSLRESLQRLEKQGVDIRLVQCVQEQHPNLAIVDLVPATGTRSAGVPLFMDVRVKNFGPDPIQHIRVEVETRLHTTAMDGGNSLAQSDDLPDLVIENLAVGETVTRQAQVFFPTSGQHVVLANIVADAIAADNQRWSVVDLPDGVPTLIIDNDPRQNTAYFLQSAFQPGTRTRTGIRTEIQPTTFLRDSSSDELAKYAVIYLAGFDQLHDRAMANLQTFVERGGGLVVFLGPTVEPRFLNDWHADGIGLFPMPVEAMADLPIDEEGTPDIVFHEHMIFRAFRGERNPFAAGIRVSKYMKRRTDWEPAADSSVQILATLKNGDPLVMERPFSRGRVIVFTTSADTSWNNWPRDPTYVVTMLQTQAYLSSSERDEIRRFAGNPIPLQLDASVFTPDVLFRLLSAGSAPGPEVRTTATATASDSPVYSCTIGENKQDGRRTGDTDRAGIYEAITKSLDGNEHVQRFALNVDPSESDLSLLDRRQLAAQLDPIAVTIHDANDIVYGSLSDEGTSWSELLLLLLLAILLAEQFLAYSTSYHPQRVAAVRSHQ